MNEQDEELTTTIHNGLSNNKKFEVYVVDTETTGIDPQLHDVIELSLYRLSDNTQKTWLIKPLDFKTIQPDALRVNGHKLEDITHQTKHGKDNYIEPAKAVAEIENWLMDDMHSSDERLLAGHNVLRFDLDMIIGLWGKSNASETFPFSKRFALDSMQLEIFLDIARGTESEYYNLSSLIAKHGIKKLKSHAAATDTIMTKDLILKQLALVSNDKQR